MRQRSLARSTSCVKLTFSGSVESQYLVGSASPSGHSINSHSGDSFSGIRLLYPTRTRTRAKREDSWSAEPSRHVTVRQACFGRPSATFLAETSSGSSRRRKCQIFCVRGLCEGCIAVVSCISRTLSSIPWWLIVAGQQALSRPQPPQAGAAGPPLQSLLIGQTRAAG